MKYRIAGLVVTATGATLYTEDGKPLELRSEDPRAAALIAKITPIIAVRQIAEVDLAEFSAIAEVEQKTKGKVKFFRVFTNKLKDIFGFNAQRSLPSSYDDGMIKHPVSDKVQNQTGVPVLTEQSRKKLEEAHQGHEPVSGTTLVAVVDNTPIVGAEALSAQIEAAARSKGRPVGFERFMQRLAAVARERKHTAEELLAFIEKADLPIADDGCIVGYKALTQREKGNGRFFVDNHTKKVPQRVGSRVEMPVEKVDDNRRVLCSNGLHVARRKYLSGYGGDVITLVKVAPEDVISVPMGEPDKMRAAAYHIVAELPETTHGLIKSDKPMTAIPDAQVILGNVIKGNHIGVIETVHIGGDYGANVTVTKTGDAPVEPLVLNENLKAKALDDKPKGDAGPLDPKKVNEKAAKAMQKAAAEGNLAAALTTSLTADPTPKPKVAENSNAELIKAAKKIEDKTKREAVIAVLNGMPKREAERKFDVPARTIGRAIEKLAA